MTYFLPKYWVFLSFLSNLFHFSDPDSIFQSHIPFVIEVVFQFIKTLLSFADRDSILQNLFQNNKILFYFVTSVSYINTYCIPSQLDLKLVVDLIIFPLTKIFHTFLSLFHYVPQVKSTIYSNCSKETKNYKNIYLSKL